MKPIYKSILALVVIVLLAAVAVYFFGDLAGARQRMKLSSIEVKDNNDFLLKNYGFSFDNSTLNGLACYTNRQMEPKKANPEINSYFICETPRHNPFATIGWFDTRTGYKDIQQHMANSLLAFSGGGTGTYTCTEDTTWSRNNANTQMRQQIADCILTKDGTSDKILFSVYYFFPLVDKKIGNFILVSDLGGRNPRVPEILRIAAKTVNNKFSMSYQDDNSFVATAYAYGGGGDSCSASGAAASSGTGCAGTAGVGADGGDSTVTSTDCTNGATNYPSCDNVCTNGYMNYPTCGPEPSPVVTCNSYNYDNSSVSGNCTNTWTNTYHYCSDNTSWTDEGAVTTTCTTSCTPTTSTDSGSYQDGCAVINWTETTTVNCDGTTSSSRDTTRDESACTTTTTATCTNGYTNYPTCGPVSGCGRGTLNDACPPAETTCNDPAANNYGQLEACAYTPSGCGPGTLNDTCSLPSGCGAGTLNDTCPGTPSGCGAGTLNDTCPAATPTCNDPSADNYGQSGTCTYTPSGCGPGTLNDTCPMPVIRNTAVDYPNITFICDESDNYSVTYNDAYPSPQVIQRGPTNSGDTITSLVAGEGNYRLKCANPYGTDSKVVSYIAPEPTLSGLAISASPKTVEGGKNSTLLWSIINPKTTCSLTAEVVCEGGHSNCTQAQLSEESSMNATLKTTTDSNDPYNLPGYTRTVPIAVQKVAPYNNPTRNKALGKKTIPVNYTTDFILDCGSSIIKKMRVIVSDQNEG